MESFRLLSDWLNAGFRIIFLQRIYLKNFLSFIFSTFILFHVNKKKKKNANKRHENRELEVDEIFAVTMNFHWPHNSTCKERIMWPNFDHAKYQKVPREKSPQIVFVQLTSRIFYSRPTAYIVRISKQTVCSKLTKKEKRKKEKISGLLCERINRSRAHPPLRHRPRRRSFCDVSTLVRCRQKNTFREQWVAFLVWNAYIVSSNR